MLYLAKARQPLALFCIKQSVCMLVFINSGVLLVSMTSIDCEGGQVNKASSPGVIVAIVIVVIIAIAIIGAVMCYMLRRQGKRSRTVEFISFLPAHTFSYKIYIYRQERRY